MTKGVADGERFKPFAAVLMAAFILVGRVPRPAAALA
ncbi:hypothetical protein ABIC09_003154 [Bradyrhizobium sp. S3.12.5]